MSDENTSATDESASITTNTAEAGSNVGIQAEEVHNSNVYITSIGDSPERKYQVGVNYLKDGVPMRARELIGEAIARGYDNAESRFHWSLAMLSKRSYRELSADERERLKQLPEHLKRFQRDEWVHALEVLCELLEHLDTPGRDPSPTLKELQNLPLHQREMITRHCALVLTGGIKDSIWADVWKAADQKQHANNRSGRVWAYFEPDPVPPRTRHPEPNSVTIGDWIRVGVATTLFIWSLGLIGWLLLQKLELAPVVAYCGMLMCGAVATRGGFEWWYKRCRLLKKDYEHASLPRLRKAPEGGFASKVDHDFQHYINKYAPNGEDRSSWMAETSGTFSTLRDEVVELYREDRISFNRVRWLIRFLVRDVRRRWEQDLLFDYRRQYHTSLSTKIRCLSSIAAGVLMSCVVIAAAVQENSLLAILGALISMAGGRISMRGWWYIASERRRVFEEIQEYMRKKEDREAEYKRWRNKLRNIRPTETEMESWLECDRVLLINEALCHYRLAWRDITAYTIVQTPVKGCKRARVRGGPWRYSQYELRLFLITAGGVRELVRKLDVERGTFHGHERGHFRFDAVSSLRVLKSGYNYTLELTLSNGPTRTIEITEPEGSVGKTGWNEPELAKISLDSTGFGHALHVLEGIAAEGRVWIQQTAKT